MEYLVKNFMRRDDITIASTATFREAVERMIQKKTNGIVVTNGGQQVIGYISSGDLIAYVVPDYLEEDKHLAPFEAEDFFATKVREVANVPITNFMTKKVHTCKEDHSLTEAAILLAEHRIRQLPVVNEDGVFLGSITRTEVKKAMGRILDII